ncbi:hypothetical protein [Azohydromonas caseinilytica]|uniref:DUF320 domain-containing protein n=1 Tax=Azohydromonas caseinilytica TaxID=2728836 RepID=A0A848F859_9BURK|nr:hypothetical protein [Azohydromonas caseinilytica]NML15542.1 hypothetical protein [Azohydromonas caseinilytica]
MTAIRNSLIAAAVSLLALGGAVQAADQSNVGSGTSAAQQEMNRGVPGVDVDVGKNAKGAVDVNVNKNNANEPAPSRNETARGVPGVDVDVGRNANGAVDVHTDRGTGSGMRAARADRG